MIQIVFFCFCPLKFHLFCWNASCHEYFQTIVVTIVLSFKLWKTKANLCLWQASDQSESCRSLQISTELDITVCQDYIFSSTCYFFLFQNWISLSVKIIFLHQSWIFSLHWYWMSLFVNIWFFIKFGFISLSALDFTVCQN